MRILLASAVALGVIALGLHPVLAQDTSQEPAGEPGEQPAAADVDRRSVIVLTAAESALATASLFQDRAQKPVFLDWSATLSGHHWRLDGGGKTDDGAVDFYVQMTGFLTGDEGADLQASVIPDAVPIVRS